MKTFLILIGAVITLMSFSSQSENTYYALTKSYGANEVLNYRLHYGVINAGEATIMVHPQLYKVNNKVCYKTSVIGKSTGSFALAMKVNDEWTSYIDTVSNIPQKAYRYIAENNYRLNEYVQYDFNNKKAHVLRESGKEKSKSNASYDITPNMQDLVSGAYYLRQVDYSKLAIGQTITMKSFFEDKLYDFTVKYCGVFILNTKWGEISAIKLQPVMPDNKMFDGGNSIRVWISNDINRVPLRMEADMFVGKVACDLKSYSGLKKPLVFTK
jgi:hypothetical protein